MVGAEWVQCNGTVADSGNPRPGVDPAAAKATHRAAASAGAGDAAGARAALAEALVADPGYAPAWRWLAALVGADGERRFCLERAQAAEADAETGQELEQLGDVEAIPPPEAVWLTAPPRAPRAVPPPPPARRGAGGGIGAGACPWPR